MLLLLPMLMVLLLVHSVVVIGADIWFDEEFGVDDAFTTDTRLLMLTLNSLMVFSSKAYSDCTSRCCCYIFFTNHLQLLLIYSYFQRHGCWCCFKQHLCLNLISFSEYYSGCWCYFDAAADFVADAVSAVAFNLCHGRALRRNPFLRIICLIVSEKHVPLPGVIIHAHFLMSVLD